MKIRLLASLLLFAGLVACRHASAVDVGSPYFELGTNELANQDLVNANSNFQNAVTVEPAYAPANFLLAATRLLLVAQSPAGSNFLNGLGLPAAGRNYYDWTAFPATNSEGKPEFPKGYNSGTAIAFYTNTLMPVISASLTNLANITDSTFQLVLPANVTGGGTYEFQDVTVDYGDVQVLRAMLTAGQFLGYSLSANNANADMSWIETNIQAKTLTIQSLLTQFPSLAAKQNTAALAPSEQAAINAIELYFGAASFILDDRTDTNALFNLSTNDFPAEIQFQTDLTNILLSLTTPTQLASNNIGSTLYLAPYFAGNVSIRSLVPKFNGDAYVPDSVSDYTFGGIFPDLPSYETESGLLKKFPNYAGIYIGDQGLYDSFNYAYGSFAAYVSTNGQVTVIGWDPGDYGGDGSDFGILVQATLSKGNWESSNSVFDAYGNVGKDGSFNGEIDYTNGQSVFLNAFLAPPTGPFQNSAGNYTGSYTGSRAGSLYAVVAADGEIFFTTGKSGPGGSDGGSSQFSYTFGNPVINTFFANEVDGTTVTGLLNTNSVTADGVSPGNIAGIYSNYLNGASGTFSLSRSSKILFDSPPMITTDLPPVLTVGLANTTTFQLGVSGTPPLSYQWFFNGNLIPGANSSSLVVSNNLWTTTGEYSISATVADVAGETNSQVSDVLVNTTLPPIAGYAGIYVGNSNTGTNGVTDSDGFQTGALAAYVSTNGQVTVMGQDDGDSNPNDSNNFGFLFQATLTSGGDFQYNNSYYSAYGSVNSLGQFYAQLYFPQANGGSGEYAYLTGNLQTPQGPFQITDGLYTGTYAGAQSGNVDVIFDANGDFFLVPLNASANGNPYGNAGTGAVGQFSNGTQFSIPGFSGTIVAGTLNPNTFVINGTYTNTDASHGTFTVSRSSTFITPVPPVITTDLPANVNVPLGSTVTFSLGASGSQPLSYQWYYGVGDADPNPIPGAMTNTLVVSNNLWATTGAYTISAIVANGAGATNSRTCAVNVTAETNVPTVAITSPTSGELWSNSTFTVTGTSSDKVGVTGIICIVNGYVTPSTLNPANGQWTATATLTPGTNTISARAENEGFVLSPTNTVLIDYLPTNQMTVQISGKGTVSPNYNNAWLFDGRNYSMTASAGSGLALGNWSAGLLGGPLTVYTNNPTVVFNMSSNLVLQANFVDANKPYLKITNAISGMTWGSGTFTVMGVATDDEEVASVNYSFNQSPYTNIATLTGIHWSSAPLALMAGTNLFSAFDVATNGNISATSTVAIVYLATNYLTIQISGKGTVSPNYPSLADGHNYSMTANPGSGFIFSNWMGGIYPNPLVVLTNKPTLTFMMETNLVVQADFLDTLKPYLKITNPVSPVAFLTNVTSYTVMGVATDDEEVASVDYSFNRGGYTPASINGNQWSSASLSLMAGTNVFSVYAQATNSNYSPTSTVQIVMISTNLLTLQISGKGTISPNYSNALLDAGVNYSMAATAASGFKFINWTAETNPVLLPGINPPAIISAPSFSLYSTNSKVTFMMETGLVMQANFKDLNPPFLKITNVVSQLITNSGTFTVMGVATDDEQMSFVTYSFNGSPPSEVDSVNGWTNWSEQLTLAAGTNVFSVYATATNGNMATNTVKIVSISTNQLKLQISGKGTISPNYSNAWLDVGVNYKMNASAATGFKFSNWTATTNGIGSFTLYGTNSALTFMMETGLVIQANFADTIKPYLNITNPLAKMLTTNVSSYTLMGVATDDQEVATVNYTFNGTASNLAISNNIAVWQVPVSLSEGTNTFSAWAIATNGNISATNTVTIIRWPTVTIFPIATNNVAFPQGQLGFDGSNYLVVYQAGPDTNASAAGQFVSTNGTLEGQPLPLNPGGKDAPPCIDFDGTNYLVAWVDGSDEQAGVPIRGVFVSAASQQPVGNVLTLSQSTKVGDLGSVVYGGGLYFLMWPDNHTAPSSIYGALIDTSGTNVSGDFAISANGTEGEFAGPQAAFDGENFLAVWTSVTGNMTISGQLINGSGPVGSPFVIYTNSGPSGIAAPSVVFNGTNYLVLFNVGITSAGASASGFHVLGRLVTTAGAVLTNQITMTADAGPQIVPGGDFDGVNFVASWNQGWNPFSLSTSGIINGRFFDAMGKPTSAEFPIFTTGAGLTSLASVLQPPVIKLASGNTATWAPVYFDGSKFVLVGGFGKPIATPGVFTNGVIYGAFVSP